MMAFYPTSFWFNFARLLQLVNYLQQACQFHQVATTYNKPDEIINLQPVK